MYLTGGAGCTSFTACLTLDRWDPDLALMTGAGLEYRPSTRQSALRRMGALLDVPPEGGRTRQHGQALSDPRRSETRIVKHPAAYAAGVGLAAGLAACAALRLPKARTPPVRDRVPDSAGRLPALARREPRPHARGWSSTDAPLATQVGVDVLARRRQRRRRRGRDRVRARRRLPRGRQHRRRRLRGRAHGGRRRTAALDFRETAPAAATRDMYLDADGEPTDRRVDGHQSPPACPAASPGSGRLHQTLGSTKTTWAELARAGDRASPRRASSSTKTSPASVVERQASGSSSFPASAALFLPGGAPLQRRARRGSNPELAAVARRIAEKGPQGFYEGETADLIVARDEARRRASSRTRTCATTARSGASRSSSTYRGHTIISMPPPSSGGDHARADRAHPRRLRPRRSSAGSRPRRCTSSPRRCAARSPTATHTSAIPDFVEDAARRAPLAGVRRAASARDDRSRARDALEPSSQVAVGADGARAKHTTHFSVVDARGQRGRAHDDDQLALRLGRHGRGRRASSSTTRWTTSPPCRAPRTCSAWCRARRTRSRPASACSRR